MCATCATASRLVATACPLQEAAHAHRSLFAVGTATPYFFEVGTATPSVALKGCGKGPTCPLASLAAQMLCGRSSFWSRLLEWVNLLPFAQKMLTLLRAAGAGGVQEEGMGAGHGWLRGPV